MRLVHLVGVSWGIFAASRAIALARLRKKEASVSGTRLQLLERCLPWAMIVYALGFCGMLSASAAYNVAWSVEHLQGQLPAGTLACGVLNSIPVLSVRAIALLRQLDHTWIYVCIAGSYTPLALTFNRRNASVRFLIFVWILAICGVLLKATIMNGKVTHSHATTQFLESLGFWLYIGLGWAGAAQRKLFAAALSPIAKRSIMSGGFTYMIGIPVHLSSSLLFQNAIWHVLVLAATMCIYRGVSSQFFAEKCIFRN